MDDDIKKIAALIGHQQAQEKRVNALIEAFKAKSALLSKQTALLVDVINQLDSKSGQMNQTVKQSINLALSQVKKEIKEEGIKQQAPTIEALNEVTVTAQQAVNKMKSEMSRYTWKSAISLLLTIVVVMTAMLASVTYFIDNGYDKIAKMQAMEAQWEQKAPLANISTCNGEPCVQVIDKKYTNQNGDVFYKIKSIK